MDEPKYVKHFTNEEARIGVQIESFTPAYDGGKCSPSDPAEVEFTAYFVTTDDEVICQVPDELVGYYNLRARVLTYVIERRASDNAEAAVERYNDFMENVYFRMMEDAI